MATNKQIATRVSLITILGNILLSVLELIAGILSMSSAMISDAVNTLSDVFSSVVVIIGVRMSDREADESHQYGHERFECVAGVILAVVLAVTGAGIGYDAVLKIIEGINGELPALTDFALLALIAAVVTMATKEVMYRYTRRAAKKISSSAMLADAWHHRSDVLASLGSFVGIGGAMLGFPLLDPIAGAIICLLILKVAFDIARDAFNKMVDKSCDAQTSEAIKQTAQSVDGVCEVDELKTRLFGDKIFVEAEISCNPLLTLAEAHDIAEEVHLKIETEFPHVKHCVVHVNPAIQQIETTE